MTKNEQAKAQQRLGVLVGKSLRSLSRSADMLEMGFGALIEAERPYVAADGHWARDDNGQFAHKTNMLCEHLLHVECHFRMRCGYEVVFAKCDLYHASAKCEDREYDDDFDVRVRGNNRLDEVIAARFTPLEGYIVKMVKAHRTGDLSILFANGFIFEAQIDVSGPQECWRFFQYQGTGDLVILGTGAAAQTCEVADNDKK